MNSFDEAVRMVRKKNATGRGKKIVGRIAALFGLLILCLIIFLLGVTFIICKGPSPLARNLYINTVMETSAGKFLAKMYYSDEEIKEIMAKNSATENDEITDENLISIPVQGSENNNDSTEPGLVIEDISSSTFRGKIMIIKDPSRVKVSVPDKLGEDAAGLSIDELVKKEGAIAGINAGGFADEGGIGNGGQPLGIVIKDSELVHNEGYSCVIGFDTDNRLIVGNMTADQAAEKNLRDAVSFGPVFIVNGKKTQVAGWGSGLNPRTCIGQREDGAVLLLTIDGRQASSLGATYEDCINILEEYGAINAANLDGGSSTVLYYNGKVINECASVYGPRQLPTAIVVMPEN